MGKMEYIVEDEVIITDHDLYNNKCYKEHSYCVSCYDGYAIGIILDGEDVQVPHTIRMEYPKLHDVLKDNDLCRRILKYRGLWDKSSCDIHYGDVMMYMGRICR